MTEHRDADKEPDFAELKARLLARRAELEALAAASSEARATVDLDQSRLGRLSRMDALQGQAMAQEVERRRQGELARIDAALARMKKGEYGYCLKCGEDIATARLALDPSATLCIDCAG